MPVVGLDLIAGGLAVQVVGNGLFCELTATLLTLWLIAITSMKLPHDVELG